MDCTQSQQSLYEADIPATAALPADVAAHVAQCPACQTLLANLARLEKTAHDLPSPPDCDAARSLFLRQLDPARTSFRLPWKRIAIAAAVLICIGLSVWVLTPRPREIATAPPDSVVDRLVRWNVELSEAQSAQERDQILAQGAPLKHAVDTESLAAGERDLASRLLENGAWMSVNIDPLARAERFDQLADLLLKRLRVATAAGDNKSVEQFSRYYAIVVSRGADPQLDTAELAGLATPERRHRHKQAVERHAEFRRQLDDLLQQAPEISRKQILRELGLAKPHRRPRTTQPAPSSRFD